MKRKIALVDDHTIVRNGLKTLIEKLGPYKVVSEYNDGLPLVNSYPFSDQFELIILDLTMPTMGGEETVDRLNELGSQVPILILTLNTNERTIVKLFRAGVRGYLAKDCTAETMKKALESIFNSGYYHNEFLLFSLHHDTPKKRLTEQEKILEQLTDREHQFLKLVCHEDEYTYDQIAGIMGVQHRTVDGYRESIFDKFSIKSKTGLVLFILKHKLLELL